MTDVNDHLPAVTVKDSTGNDVALGSLPGPLVLNFYPRTSPQNSPDLPTNMD